MEAVEASVFDLGNAVLCDRHFGGDSGLGQAGYFAEFAEFEGVFSAWIHGASFGGLSVLCILSANSW